MKNRNERFIGVRHSYRTLHFRYRVKKVVARNLPKTSLPLLSTRAVWDKIRPKHGWNTGYWRPNRKPLAVIPAYIFVYGKGKTMYEYRSKWDDIVIYANTPERADRLYKIVCNHNNAVDSYNKYNSRRY